MLLKKMYRDILKNLSQFVTIFLMVLISLAAYTGVDSYMKGLEKSATKYYKNYNLSDATIYGKTTQEELANLKKSKYIKNIEEKLTINFNLKNNKKVEVNFIKENTINKMYIHKGEKFSNKKGIWIDKKFAEENKLKVGDKILLKYKDKEIEEKILGLISTPDHVYITPDDNTVFPNHKDYAYAYMSLEEVQNILEIPKNYLIYSTVMIKTNNYNKLKEEIEKNFSNKIIIQSKDTKSYLVYQSEIDEGKSYIGIFSGLFVLIAILCLITTMIRLVKKDRINLGTLKALGYSNLRIGIHYISYGFYISLIASILGAILGLNTLGKFFMGLEMKVFDVPNGDVTLGINNLYMIIFIVVIISVTSYLSVRHILKEKPANILRGETSSNKSRNLNLKKLKLSFESKWNIRDIYRNKFRTITTLIGITGSTLLVITGFGLYDTMNNYLYLESKVINRYEYKGSIIDNTKEYNNTSKRLPIEINGKNNNLFVDDTKGMIRLIDKNNKEINLKDGLFITRKLAKKLNKKIGDKLSFKIKGNNEIYTVEITGINKDHSNQNITMNRKTYEKLGLKYLPDTIYSNKKIKDSNVNKIQSIKDINEGITNMTNMLIKTIVMLVILSIILGGVIIYNMSILSFTDKEYQFATLKVLGFSNKKISKIFIIQNIWISIISTILAQPIGYGIVKYMYTYAIGSEYDMNVYIKSYSYIISIVLTLILTLTLSKLLTKKIAKIDMVKSLKANE